jgi:hypothetical protein
VGGNFFFLIDCFRCPNPVRITAAAVVEFPPPLEVKKRSTQLITLHIKPKTQTTKPTTALVGENNFIIIRGAEP